MHECEWSSSRQFVDEMFNQTRAGVLVSGFSDFALPQPAGPQQFPDRVSPGSLGYPTLSDGISQHSVGQYFFGCAAHSTRPQRPRAHIGIAAHRSTLGMLIEVASRRPSQRGEERT